MNKAMITATALAFLTSASAFAAPCATGTTTSTRGPKTSDTSSNVESNTPPRVSPGAKGESAGTVGAMDRSGVNTPDKGEKPLPEGKPIEGQNSDDC